MHELTSAPSASTHTRSRTRPHRGWRDRRATVLGAVASAVLAGFVLAEPVAAHAPWVSETPSGDLHVDGVDSVLYHGARYSWPQIDDLQKHGKALDVVADVDAARHGYALAFDDDTESHAWACTEGPLKGRPACSGAVQTK